MQNGVRHFRALKIVYRPDVPNYEYICGGMKKWVEGSWLADFKARNPEVSVEVQTVDDPIERQGDLHFPRAVGYYLNGTSQTILAARFGAEAIDQMIYQMRNTCNEGSPLPAQNAVIKTHTPSVQGMWTPYLWMKDAQLVEEAEPEDAWRDEIKDIAKFVRMKKIHRDREFEKKNYVAAKTRQKLENRWQEEVFPYTVGQDTRAVPGRLFLEETKTIFPEAGQTPPQSSLEKGGGGYMGGFVSPFSKAETSALGSDSEQGNAFVHTGDKYNVSKHQRGGTVPPFAGAPFTSGYGDHENYWKNWDLFTYSSQSYSPPRSEVPTRDYNKTRRAIEIASQVRQQKGREDNWAKES